MSRWRRLIHKYRHYKEIKIKAKRKTPPREFHGTFYIFLVVAKEPTQQDRDHIIPFRQNSQPEHSRLFRSNTIALFCWSMKASSGAWVYSPYLRARMRPYMDLDVAVCLYSTTYSQSLTFQYSTMHSDRWKFYDDVGNRTIDRSSLPLLSKPVSSTACLCNVVVVHVISKCRRPCNVVV